MEVREAQRLNQMEDENRRLKLLGAELSLHGEALKAVIRKKGGACRAEAEVVFVSAEYRLSDRRACKLLGVERSSYRYEPRPVRNAALREDLVKLACQKPRYGYRRLHALLTRSRGEREAGVPAVCGRGSHGAAAQAQAAGAGSGTDRRPLCHRRRDSR